MEKKYNDNDAKKLNYYYNSQGNISAIVDYMSGTTTRYIYDFCGRIVEIRENNGTNIASHAYNKSTKYTYADKTNYISKVEYLENGQTNTVEYEYGSTDTATMPDAVYSVKLDGTQQLAYTYDSLGRLSTRKIVPANLQRTYTYLQGGYGANSTTTLVDSVTENGITTSYTYDALGNISAVYKNGTLYESYTYDALNQLASYTDNNGDTYSYTYLNGNILSVTQNGQTIKTYTYGDTSWKDLLTAYNGETITYDAIGNPLSYRGKYTFTWSEGRNLTGVVANGGAYSHTYYYDASGRRVKKDYGSYSTVFTYLDDRLYSQTTGQEVIIFLYDEQGRMYGLDYNGTRYYYRINALGDVTGIYNSSGQLVTEYTYDAWGSLINLTGSEAFEVGSANPILYRGYYCDYDTNLYYLQSRYYDPETGRFISADGLMNQESILGNNLFAYCLNNPVNMIDSTGNLPQWMKDAGNWINKNFFQPVGNFISKTVENSGAIFKALIESIEIKISTGFGLSAETEINGIGASVGFEAKMPEFTIGKKSTAQSIGEFEVMADLMIFEFGYKFIETLDDNSYIFDGFVHDIKDSVSIIKIGGYFIYGVQGSIDFKLKNFIEKVEIYYE